MIIWGKIKQIWAIIRAKPTRNGHILTDEDREKSKEYQDRAREITRLERQVILQKRLEKLEDAIHGDRAASFEEKLISSVLPMVLPQLQQQNAFKTQTMPTQQQNLNIGNTIEVSDEQIEQFLVKNPQLVSIAKTLDDKQIHDFIKGKEPQVGDDSIRRCIAKIKSK